MRGARLSGSRVGLRFPLRRDARDLPGVGLLASALSAEAAPPSQAEKAAALARLYGVVRWFHPSDAAQEIDWDRFAVKAAGNVRAAGTALDLMRTLRALFAPVAVGVVVDRQLPASPPPKVASDEKRVAWRHLGPGFGSAGGGFYASARTHRSGQPPFEAPLLADAHVDLDLGLGLRARVPLVLTDGEANIGTEQRPLLAALQAQLAALPQTLDTADQDVRAGDVIVAWSALRHFYPYWPEAGVDWDERLSPLLAAAAAATSRGAPQRAPAAGRGVPRRPRPWRGSPRTNREVAADRDALARGAPGRHGVGCARAGPRRRRDRESGRPSRRRVVRRGGGASIRVAATPHVEGRARSVLGAGGQTA